MLEAVNLHKSFEGKSVIRDFSQQFLPGVHYVLMGPSGCGKTTLLNLLMGLLKPDAGEVRNLQSTRFSAVFQENRLLDYMTPAGNIRLVCDAEPQAIEQMLLGLGLEKASLSQPVSEFSGGMKRRVALARALLADYDVLFLDEPYKGLDEDTRQQVRAVVRRCTKGKTVILVTHDPAEAEGLEKVRI